MRMRTRVRQWLVVMWIWSVARLCWLVVDIDAVLAHIDSWMSARLVNMVIAYVGGYGVMVGLGELFLAMVGWLRFGRGYALMVTLVFLAVVALRLVFSIILDEEGE